MKARALADPVAMEVFSNRLLSLTEEMGSNLMSRYFRNEPHPCHSGVRTSRARNP